MKVAVITCYKQNDYVRARTLRAALAAAPGVTVLVIRNRHRGPLRYIEVSLKILRARWRERPDAYVITFRGYEMLLFMVMTLTRRPIIFDEMINFTEWLEEHRRLKSGSLAYRLFRRCYAWLVGHCRFILADTAVHARYSAQLNRLGLERYRVIPIGTDETVFYPRKVKKPEKPFTVFYYGSMLPLHGLSYLLEAAVLLKDEPGIDFRFVGGKKPAARACAAAVEAGARVSYEAWLPFEELAEAAAAADLGVGGPFGGTLQSEFVITGKTYQFLALGTPVLIGGNQATAEFTDKLDCLMVAQADAAALAEAIRWADKHPKELKRIGQQGRKLYEKAFSQPVINRLAERLIKSL